MDNSVERDKQVEGQFPDLVANFKLLVTNVEKLKNSHKSLKQEVSRLQVERDKAIEENERMKIALHNIYNTETKGSLADLHGAMAAIKTMAHIGLGVPHDPLD